MWITRLPAKCCPQATKSAFHELEALASVQTRAAQTRRLKPDGTKIASLFLQAQLLLFRQNDFGDAQSRHKVKVFSEVLVAMRGVV
jgi:hypothetical protein